ILQLDSSHGQHHHLQHALGHRPQRMAWLRQQNKTPRRSQPPRPHHLHGHRRLRQLPRHPVVSIAAFAAFPKTPSPSRIGTSYPPPKKTSHPDRSEPAKAGPRSGGPSARSFVFPPPLRPHQLPEPFFRRSSRSPVDTRLFPRNNLSAMPTT